MKEVEVQLTVIVVMRLQVEVEPVPAVEADDEFDIVDEELPFAAEFEAVRDASIEVILLVLREL